MRRQILLMIIASTGLLPRLLYGATATFVAVGPTTVPPGTDVTFDVLIRADDPGGFDAADIIIGSNGAAGITFSYSSEWIAAFDNVTTPVTGMSFYANDVFAGANGTQPVVGEILLGTITLSTNGMAEGDFDVRIDPVIDDGVSRVTLTGTMEPLFGSAQFTIECAGADTDCDGDVDLLEFADLQSCMTGPSTAPAGVCDPQDTNNDGRVDLKDASLLMRQFTGQQ